MAKKKRKKKYAPVTTILPLRNPVALDLPPIHALFDRAFLTHRWLDGKHVIDLLRGRDLEQTGIFLARKHCDYTGLVIATLPDDTMPWAKVFHIYAEDREARDQLTDAAFDWARDQNHGTVITGHYMNKREQIRSKAVCRTFGKRCRGGKVVGHIIAFDVRPER